VTSSDDIERTTKLLVLTVLHAPDAALALKRILELEPRRERVAETASWRRCSPGS
jgi:hypothetical protein